MLIAIIQTDLIERSHSRKTIRRISLPVWNDGYSRSHEGLQTQCQVSAIMYWISLAEVFSSTSVNQTPNNTDS